MVASRKGKIKMKKIMKTALVLVAAFVLFSCASTGVAKEEYNAVRSSLASGNMAQALQEMEKSRGSYTDPVLYYIDYGMVNLYAGRVGNAIKCFAEAEKAVSELSAASVSEGISSYITNDYAKAYSGSKYEDVYLNCFSALAYYQAGDLDEAMVEVRKVNTKMKDYERNKDKQTALLEQAVFLVTPKPYALLEIPKVEDFSTSRFAQYLSMLLYRDSGDSDNAYIDYKALVSQGVGVDEADYSIPKGKGVVNFVSFEGLIAPKAEAVVYADIGNDVKSKITYPVISDYAGSAVSYVEVAASNGQSIRLDLIEDVSDLARNALNMDVKFNYLKSFYRSIAKMKVAQETADIAMKEAEDAAKSVRDEAMKAASRQNMILRKIAETAADKAYQEALKKAREIKYQAFNEVNETEKADTRMGMYLPDRISAGSMVLDPGTYTFTITYGLGKGKVSFAYQNVVVSEGEGKILVTTCAR